MIWFIDIDGTVCDNVNSFVELSKLWLDNHCVLHTSPNLKGYYIGEVFGVDNSLGEVVLESSEFANYYIQPPTEGAIETLKYLKERGDMVIFITARDADLRVPVTSEICELTKCGSQRKTISIRRLTLDWLDYYGVPYDNLIFRADKMELFTEYKGVVIEDSPSTLKLCDEHSITSVTISYPYNAGLGKYRVSTWSEIRELADKITVEYL